MPDREARGAPSDRTAASWRSTSVSGSASRTIDEQRHARVAAPGSPRTSCRCSIVALWRRAMPKPCAPRRRRSPDALPWFSTRAHLLGRQVGVADDAAVRGDERDARADRMRPSASASRVELLLAGRRAVRRGSPPPCARCPPARARCAARDCGGPTTTRATSPTTTASADGRERGQEDLGAERHGRSGLSGDRRACTRTA